MRLIPVYKTEYNAGLSQQILTQASVSYITCAEIVAPDNIPLVYNSTTLKAVAGEHANATNEGQIDLHYIKSVLATVGWNKNDDVFDKAETWSARTTPEDKPFNLEHNARDIIGHITGNFALDLEGNIIDNDTPVYKLPDVYHIAAASVLYKYWPEKELLERMEKIIAEIGEKKWFISMEALFDNFDYAVMEDDGQNYVIARSESSAFLTKHLRAYGGSGVYEGKKVGRLLRNIVFSGKGLVRKPANPHSIIFDNVKAFVNFTNATSIVEKSRVKSNSGYTSIDNKNSIEEINRMPELTQVDLLQNENKRLEQTLQAAVAAQKDAEKRLVEMNEQAVKAKIDGFTNDIKARDEKITSLTTQVQTEQKARTEAEVKLADLQKQVADLQTQLNKVITESKAAARVAVVSSELSMNQGDAQKFYDDNFADLNLSDDRFAKLVASFKSKAGNSGTGNNTSGTTTTTVLDNATPTEKPAALGTDGVNKSIEQVRAGLGNFLAKNCLRKQTAVQE